MISRLNKYCLRSGGRSNEKVIAVGDGANDLLMLQQASLGVAYNGKPKLQENVCPSSHLTDS